MEKHVLACFWRICWHGYVSFNVVSCNCWPNKSYSTAYQTHLVFCGIVQVKHHYMDY